MTLRSYLFLMTTSTVLCWISFICIILRINPETTNFIGLILFYLSLSLSLIGTTAIIGFIVRFIFLKHELAFQSVREAFRQSFLFTALIITSLILLSNNLFDWVNLSLLIITLSVLEFIMLGYSDNSKTKTQNSKLNYSA